MGCRLGRDLTHAIWIDVRSLSWVGDSGGTNAFVVDCNQFAESCKIAAGETLDAAATKYFNGEDDPLEALFKAKYTPQTDKWPRS